VKKRYMNRLSADSTGQPAAFVNAGDSPRFNLIDIGHKDYVAAIEGDTAFWMLLPRKQALEHILGDRMAHRFRVKQQQFEKEMNSVRFGLVPSAVYFNPTERCNLNCQYCYIPESMRRSGCDMSSEQLHRALEILADFFSRTLPKGSRRPQIIFHGSEPLLAKEAVFKGIEQFVHQFSFGIQTNATLLDDEALEFIRCHEISVGISLDAHQAAISDQTRKNWQGTGFFKKLVTVLERLAGYPHYSVICTITTANVNYLSDIVDFLHHHTVPVAMLNPVRCTQPGGRELKPDNLLLADQFSKALNRTIELLQCTGRKLVIANFANVLAGIVAPTARRLMCDISPCGGGRCFFAVGAAGDLFPCSEFIGIPEFKSGNLFKDKIEDMLHSLPVQQITGRKVEDIKLCSSCAIRHFCGAPCPAEVYMCSNTVLAPPPYCEFYVEQIRYAFRVIAAGHVDDYLWENWKTGTEKIFELD
jgi:uncharacterized protein